MIVGKFNVYNCIKHITCQGISGILMNPIFRIPSYQQLNDLQGYNAILLRVLARFLTNTIPTPAGPGHDLSLFLVWDRSIALRGTLLLVRGLRAENSDRLELLLLHWRLSVARNRSQGTVLADLAVSDELDEDSQQQEREPKCCHDGETNTTDVQT